MALERIYLFIFVIYCTTVGTVLSAMPWSPAWDQLVLHLPIDIMHVMQNFWVRGAISGFGLVHLIWSIHDLNRVLAPNIEAHPPARLSDHSRSDHSRQDSSAQEIPASEAAASDVISPELVSQDPE